MQSALVVVLACALALAHAWGAPDASYCPPLPYPSPAPLAWPTKTQYCTANYGPGELYNVFGDYAGCVAWGSASHGRNLTLARAQLLCLHGQYLHNSTVLYGRCVAPYSGEDYPYDAVTNPTCGFCSQLNAAEWRHPPYTLPPTTDPNAPTTSEAPNPVKKRNDDDGSLKRGPKTPKPTTTKPSTTAPQADPLNICGTVNPYWPAEDYSYGCQWNFCDENANDCFELFPDSPEEWGLYRSPNRLSNWYNSDVTAQQVTNYLVKFGHKTAQDPDLVDLVDIGQGLLDFVRDYWFLNNCNRPNAFSTCPRCGYISRP